METEVLQEAQQVETLKYILNTFEIKLEPAKVGFFLFIFYFLINFSYDKCMKKLIPILLIFAISSTALSSDSVRKNSRKLSRGIKIKVTASAELSNKNEYCTRQMLQDWQDWWKEVKKPYIEKYRKEFSKLSKIEITSSKQTQSITGSQDQLYLIKSHCTGGVLGRSCSKLDSKYFRLKIKLQISGTTPKYDINIGSSANVYIEYAQDSSALKRYDTFTRSVFEKVEKNNKLFENYFKIGMIGQLVNPGTNTSVRKLCSYPQLPEILLQL